MSLKISSIEKRRFLKITKIPNRFTYTLLVTEVSQIKMSLSDIFNSISSQKCIKIGNYRLYYFFTVFIFWLNVTIGANHFFEFN